MLRLPAVPRPRAALAAATILALTACKDDPSEPGLPLDGDAVLENGALLVRGNGDGNLILITYSAAGVAVERDGESTQFTDPVASIEVEAGEGDDVIRYEQVVVGDLELTLMGGAGDDEVLVSFDPAGSGDKMELAAALETGPGSDRLDFRWNGGAVPALNAFANLTVNGTALAPEQGDEVLISFEGGDVNAPYVIGALWNGRGPEGAPPESDPRGLDLEVDFTAGHADVTLQVTGGAGPDELDVDVDYSGVTLQQGRITVAADLGEGDNHFGKYVVTSATHTYVETSVVAGDGNNTLDLENVLGGDGSLSYSVGLGEGDNHTSVVFGDGERGARPATGERVVTGSYESGGGANTVELHGNTVEPITSDVTVDFGEGQGTAIGRYTFRDAWPTDAPPGAQTVPSQMRVLILSPGGSDLDLRIDVPDPSGGPPEQAGSVAVAGSGVRGGRLDFLRLLELPLGRVTPGEAWTLQVSDLHTSGETSVAVEPGPAVDRIVYLQDAVEVGAGATMKMTLQGHDGPDAVLAHLIGLSGAGHFDFLADGGAGDDVLAALTRDLEPASGGAMAFQLKSADGDDFLGLLPPSGLSRDGPIAHALDAGIGSDVCFTTGEVPALQCERREEVTEELLEILESLFGTDLVEEWR
jgi:hypothetical protein